MAAASPRVHYDKFSVLTSTSGFQDLRSYRIMDNAVVRFEITVAARQTDGTNRAMFKRAGLFYRQSGGPVQIQGTQWQAVDTEKSDRSFDLKFLLGASALVIQSKNSGSVPTRWVGYVDLIVVK